MEISVASVGFIWFQIIPKMFQGVPVIFQRLLGGFRGVPWVSGRSRCVAREAFHGVSKGFMVIHMRSWALFMEVPRGIKDSPP